MLRLGLAPFVSSRTMAPWKKRINRQGRTEQELITIRGLVTPYEWDEKGNVIAIAISTFDEEEYLIDKDKQSNQLLSLMRQAVEVSGFVKEENGKKRIKLKKYSLCRV